ncbi:MAG: hypothetical protein M3527_00750 [Actinomycetota bacterium]|nr:hypothetical protein [Acidimicrobiia bacterium]MDQ3292971.1 hypothetical protein [Actinomycetota bacterium]
MLDDDTRALLEAGSSTIVGLVDRAGEPFATRGWGSVVLDGEPLRLRVLVGAGAFAAAGYHPGAEARFAVAVTGAEVRTLVSVQVKGTAVALDEADDDDRRRTASFCEDFFGAVKATDNIDRALMERLVPADLWACTIEVDEVFDQTPGPRAGSRLDR